MPRKQTNSSRFSIAWATAYQLKAEGKLSAFRWTHFECPKDDNWQHYAAKVETRVDGLWLVLGRASKKDGQVETNKLVSVNWTKLTKNTVNLVNNHVRAAA